MKLTFKNLLEQDLQCDEWKSISSMASRKNFKDEKKSEKNLTEEQTVLLIEEQLMENILTSIQAAIDKVKEFGGNISGGLRAKSELKAADGKKTNANANMQKECIKLRNELHTLYNAATPEIKATFDAGLSKLGATRITGVYLSRNYYSDYIAYSLLKPIFDVNRANITDKAKQIVADKFIGFVVTAVTGIPNLDDIKDAAEMSVALVKASNALGAKWKSLKVTSQ